MAFLIFMGFSAFVMHAGLWGWLKTLKGTPAVDAARGWTPPASGSTKGKGFPVLQVKPQHDWLAYRQEQEAFLNNYGWVNRTAGLVRIPISEAMERVMRDGLPRWGPTNRSISPLELQRARAGKGAD